MAVGGTQQAVSVKVQCCYIQERSASKGGSIGLPQLASVYTIQYEALHRAGPSHFLCLAVFAEGNDPI